MDDFPTPGDAPEDLRSLNGGCGPLVAWQVLANFGKRVTSNELLAACRFDANVGVYPVGLAVALARFGLRVEFFSDHDPSPEDLERKLYREADSLGVKLAEGISLEKFAAWAQDGAVGIVFYEAKSGEPYGHFTPVLGLYHGEVITPNEGDGISTGMLEQARQAPGILRQLIVARASGA